MKTKIEIKTFGGSVLFNDYAERDYRLPRWIRKQGIAFHICRATIFFVLVIAHGVRKLTRSSTSAFLAVALPLAAVTFA